MKSWVDLIDGSVFICPFESLILFGGELGPGGLQGFTVISRADRHASTVSDEV